MMMSLPEAPTSMAAVRSVLVVDDDPLIRNLLRQYLAMQGHDVAEATNGLEAVWMVRRHRPAVVLIDLHMPRVGGFEAMADIRTFDPSIRIVLMTGSATEDVELRVRETGVDLLRKPFELAELDALVR